MSTTKSPAYRCRKTHTGSTRDPDPLRFAGYEQAEPCAFHSTEPALFEQHMRDVHNGGIKIRAKGLPKRLWTGPRLTDEGKPFEPTGFELGATVTWWQLVPTGETFWDPANGTVDVQEWVERSGQVWSLAHRGVWVIPFAEIPDETELAVLVRKSVLSDRLEAAHTWHAQAVAA